MVICHYKMFSLFRQSPKVSPSSYGSGQRPILKAKSEADLKINLDKENESGQLKTSKQVRFTDEETTDERVLAIELLHYGFQDLRAQKTALTIEHFMRNVSYFFPKFIENLKMLDIDNVGREDFARKLSHLWREYEDIITVDLEQATIQLGTKKPIDCLADDVCDLLRGIAAAFIGKYIKDNGGKVKATRVRKMMNSQFPYLTSRLLARTSSFDELAEIGDKTFLVFKDCLIIPGYVVEEETDGTDNSTLRRSKSSVHFVNRASQWQHQVKEPRPPALRKSLGNINQPQQLDSNNQQPDQRMPFARQTPENSHPRPHGTVRPFVGLKPIPLDAPAKTTTPTPQITVTAPKMVIESKLEMARPEMTPQNLGLRKPKHKVIVDLIAESKMSTDAVAVSKWLPPKDDKANVSHYFTVSGSAKLRRPLMTPAQMTGKPHGHSCVCGQDMDSIVREVSDADFETFFTQHTRCFIAHTKERAMTKKPTMVDAQVQTDVQIDTNVILN